MIQTVQHIREQGAKARGVILLTEARSGSTWLGSLCRASNLGDSGEWLREDISGIARADHNFNSYVDAVVERGGASQGGFYVKIFPLYLFSVKRTYGEDFIRKCLERYNTTLIKLSRRDRLRQAVSLSRGLQTAQWTSSEATKGTAEYNFEHICQSYFRVRRSDEFWEGYLELLDVPVKRFVYEDLVVDPSPFLHAVADAMGKARPEVPESDLKVQRDKTTEEWLAKFFADARTGDFLDFVRESNRPRGRSLSNLIRFLRKKPMKPFSDDDWY